ncbi:MAG: uracil-DNA glycosylase family protein, partial [Pseudomonadales bacterium]
MASHSSFEREIRSCRACPRLVAALAQHRLEFPQSHSAPVPASGPTRARLLIIGLAPGRQGANRTGRVFVGDASGRFLFHALHHCGLASDPDPFSAKLIGVRITNVLKCWPPGNKPQIDELQRCGTHLRQELSMFWHAGVRQPRGVLCLGRIAHARTCAALQTLLPT